jgi:hypothetical protein
MYENTRNLQLNLEATGSRNKSRQQSEKPWVAMTGQELSSSQPSKSMYNQGQGRDVSTPHPSLASLWGKGIDTQFHGASPVKPFKVLPEISTPPPGPPIADLTLHDLRIVPKTNHERPPSGGVATRELALKSSRDLEAVPDGHHHQNTEPPGFRMPPSRSRNGSIDTGMYHPRQHDKTPASNSNFASAPNSLGPPGIGQDRRIPGMASPLIVVSSSGSRNSISTPRRLGVNELISAPPREQSTVSVSPSAPPAPSFSPNEFYCKAVVQAITDSQTPPPAKILTSSSSLPPPRPVRLNSPMPRTPSAASSASSLVSHDMKQAPPQQPQSMSYTSSTKLTMELNNGDAVHPVVQELPEHGAKCVLPVSCFFLS